MAFPFATYAGLAIDVTALIATLISLRYAVKQRVVRLGDSRDFVILAHTLFVAFIGLEIGRNFTSSTEYMEVDTIGSTALALVILSILASLAFIVYVRPTERTFAGRVGEVFRKRLFPHGIALVGFVTFATGSEIYLVAARPYSIVTVTNFLGQTVPETMFDWTYLYIAIAYSLFFLLYPSLQLALASRREADPAVRRILLMLTVCWDTIAVSVLLFEGLLPHFGINAVRLGYFISAFAFVGSSLEFRRNTALAGLFAPTGNVADIWKPRPVSDGSTSRYSGPVLFEADPSFRYDKSASDFASEEQGSGKLVFAITSRGSPVWTALRALPGTRLLVFGDVSYAKPTSEPLEVLVPRTDEGALLKVIDETLSRAPETGKALVLDSVSDMVMTLGFDNAYKFLKKLSELLYEKKIPALLIVFTGAHEDREMNLLRSLFGSQLVLDQSGLSERKRA